MKRQGKITQIRMIMVVQDTNFRQLPDFVRRGIEYDVDDIVLRSLFHWFGLSEDLWLHKNVLNPCHPYHKEYLRVLEDPICKDPRVLNWGFDVIQEPVEFPTLAMKRAYEGKQAFNANIDKCVEDVLPDLKRHTEQGAQVILYGVGMVGKYVLEKISCGNDALPVRGFMVECAECNPKYWMGNPVKEIPDYLDTKDTDIVLVALTHANQAGVKEKLQQAGYQNIVMIDEKSESFL